MSFPLWGRGMPAKSVVPIPQRSLRILSLPKRRCSVVHYKQQWSFSRSPQNFCMTYTSTGFVGMSVVRKNLPSCSVLLETTLYGRGSMPRLVAPAILSLAFSVAAGAQTTRGTVQVKSDDGRVVYATSAPAPAYPLLARTRRIEGTGIFQLHIRADGTVSSVDILRSTGNELLDYSARRNYQRWRFRAPGSATTVKIPITFVLAH